MAPKAFARSTLVIQFGVARFLEVTVLLVGVVVAVAIFIAHQVKVDAPVCVCLVFRVLSCFRVRTERPCTAQRPERGGVC